MTLTVGEMSPVELRDMIDFIVEQKLRELLGDPDEGFSIREEVIERLQKQKTAVAEGERGSTLDEIKLQLGLD